MAEYVSSFIIPIVFLLSSSAFLFPGRDYFASFIRGAKDGLRCAVGLVPAMVLLCAAIASFRASGAAEAISAFLSPIGGALGIPSELFPLIISRPLSGAAANASFASLASDCGANSFEVFAAAVIMGSSDTLVYVLFVFRAPVKPHIPESLRECTRSKAKIPFLSPAIFTDLQR